jgi:hypothetical protein
METVITIKKNKPACKALILLAKELEKKDNKSISVTKSARDERLFEFIQPVKTDVDVFSIFEQMTNFPTLEEIRNIAWRKVS